MTPSWKVVSRFTPLYSGCSYPREITVIVIISSAFSSMLCLKKSLLWPSFNDKELNVADKARDDCLICPSKQRQAAFRVMNSWELWRSRMLLFEASLYKNYVYLRTWKKKFKRNKNFFTFKCREISGIENLNAIFGRMKLGSWGFFISEDCLLKIGSWEFSETFEKKSLKVWSQAVFCSILSNASNKSEVFDLS